MLADTDIKENIGESVGVWVFLREILKKILTSQKWL